MKTPNEKGTTMLKKTLETTKTYVAQHKTAVAMTTLTVSTIVIHRLLVREYDQFLEEKGLLDEFYGNPSED